MTKVFNKRNAKRITAVVLALISIVSTIFILPANAAAKEVTVTFDYAYDTGGNIIKFVKHTEHDGYVVGTVGEAGLTVANMTLEPIAAINVAIPENFRMLNIARACRCGS